MSDRDKIKSWLRENHNKYESASKWRKALIGFILQCIEKSRNDEAVRILIKIHELDKPGVVVNFSELRTKIHKK